MPRWFYILLLAVPLAVGADLVHLPPLIVFVLAALGILPLAGIIGMATEELAKRLGPRIGGLLNATFGNAAELIISALAVNQGLLTLVKASLTGSIIANTLFVLGVSLVSGGLRHGKQKFDAQHASVNAAMMMLAVIGLYLPAFFTLTVKNSTIIEELSILVAIVLILTYFAYLAYTVFGRGRPAQSDMETPDTARARAEQEEGGASWSVRKGIAVLAASIVGTAIVSDVLVGAVEPVTQQLGWTEFFVGVIIVPFVGNAAENYSALRFALANRLEGTLSIVAGSGMQLALLVAPLLVFLSLLVGHPMNLIFAPLELLILGIATGIFAYINLDGESNWLEGIQLLAIFLMAAVTFFFLPSE